MTEITSKEKEIKKMSYSVCNMDNKPKNCFDCMWKNSCDVYLSAERYYNAGYRKADEVRMELYETLTKQYSAVINGHKCVALNLTDLRHILGVEE